MSLDPTSSVAGLNNLSYLNQDNESKPINIVSSRAPTIRDRRYKKGTTWIDEPNDNAWILTSVRAGQANWEPSTQSAGGNAPITKYVVDQDGSGDFTTIQAALDEANADGGGQVFVRAGIYTENLTFYDKIDLWGVSENAVIIVGIHTPPSSSYLNLFRCTFQSTTDIFNSSIAGTASIIMEDCIVKVTNGYTFRLPNWTGPIYAFDIRNFGTNDGFWLNNAGAQFVAFSANIGNGTSNLFNCSGSVIIYNCNVNCPFLFQTGTSIDFRFSSFTKSLTFSSGGGFITHCFLENPSGSVITIAATNGLSICSSTIQTLTNPAISGATSSQLNLTNVSFTLNSDISTGFTNVNSKIIKGGNFISQFVVDPTGHSGAYKNVQSAINDANAIGVGDVYIKAGTYNESLTLYGNVNLIGASGSDALSTVEIVGRHALPASGDISFKNIHFTSTAAPDIFTISVTSSDIYAENCKFSMVSFSGNTFNLPSTSGRIEINNCFADGSDDGFLSYNGSATVKLRDSDLSTTTTSIFLNVTSAASVTIFNCNIQCPININANFNIDCGCLFRNQVIADVFSTGRLINSTIRSGSSAAFTHLSNSAIELIDVAIDSTNNPAIISTGPGTLTLGNITFLNNSNITGPTPLASADTKTGNIIAFDIGKGLRVAEGTNAKMGTAILVAGSIIVSTTAVTANSRIFLTTQLLGGAAGFLSVTARVPGISFTIGSSSGTDTSTVAWMLVEPA